MNPAAWTQMFETSKDQKKGLVCFVSGHKIALVVTEIGTDHIVGVSQEWSRAVVRLDQIAAVAFM